MKNMIKRLISLALCAVLVSSLAVPALADDSTTTGKTVYKDVSANTEIYVKTDTAGRSYHYFGAKNEPNGGVLYGRTTAGGTLPDGSWGMTNENQNANESIISYYYPLDDQNTLEYWSYLYGRALRDGEHALLVYLNFTNEGADCPRVINGEYDSRLNEMFTYLEGLDVPTFVRIGGEMNVWSDMAKSQDYISAFRHIANIARKAAPDTALVFSPNYSGAYREDMDDYYPGDEYVDWVGVSLYYNKISLTGDTKRDEFYGVGDVYGDPMLNVQMGVNLSRLHNKPLMITEGGPSNIANGEDISSWAAERLNKAFAFLPMVYPEIKAIVNSDYTHDWEPVGFTFYNNSVVTNALVSAVNSLSGVYLNDCNKGGLFLTAMSDSPDLSSIKDTNVTFYAYTYSSTKLKADWYIDGKLTASASEYPYAFSIERSKIASGKHNVEVRFSNGQTKLYGVDSGKVGAAVTPEDGADIPSKYAEEYVEQAKELGIVPEELLSKYKEAITRADFCKLAVALYEKCVGTEIEVDPAVSFKDTDDIYILKTASIGVVEGDKDKGTFDPGGTLTRQQAAKILAELSRAMGKPMADAAYPFTDTIANWARNYVGQVFGAGVMQGTADTIFSAQGTYQRQQSIVTMVRLWNYYHNYPIGDEADSRV